jgi:hypothetical protein
MQRIYTGPNFPKLGLYTYDRFLEDEEGNKFPSNIAAALKANPGLEHHFIDFELFAGGPPPGTPQLVPGGITRTQQRGTPIKNRSSSFIIIGKK